MAVRLSAWDVLLEHCGCEDVVVDVHQEISHGFGDVERAINSLKFRLESFPLADKEATYELLDGLADHLSEVWRHLVDGEPMVRWRREDA